MVLDHEVKEPRQGPARSAGPQSKNVRISPQLLLQRPRDRPRHREHADLRSRQGHCAGRALRGGHTPGKRPQRQEDHPGGRQGSKADARQDAGQHRRHPAHEGRRDRRLHGHRADAQAVHQESARQQAVLAQSAHHHLRALRLDAGGTPRDSRERHRCGGGAGLSDRGTDGRGNRCRSAGGRGHGIDGGGRRRRHHRSRRHLPRRHGLLGQRTRRRRQVRRSHHQLHPAQLRHADR